MASSGSGVSNASDPMAFTSDDEVATDSGVYTSDTTSTDEDDFQPFALPIFGDDVPLADGPPGEDLPLVPIPAPLPFAAVPFEEQPLDALPDDDIDLLIEGPPEEDQDGGAPMEDDVPLAVIPVVDPVVPMVELPEMEVHSDSSASGSFESVASSIPPLGFGYIPRIDDDEEMEMEDELAPEEQPAEAPVLPNDQIPVMPADHQPAPVGPEPVLAHDPVPVTDAPVIAPPAVEIPEVAPIPDPMAIFDDLAPFVTHIDPRYANTSNGWIEEDDYPPYVVPVTPTTVPVTAPLDIPVFPPPTSDTHRTDLPITFLQDIPPPRPGEGSSRQPFGHTPFMSGDSQFIPQIPYHSFVPPVLSTAPFMSQFPHTTLPVTFTPHTTHPVSAPMGEPFLWSSPHVMPVSDPYHPFHVGYSIEDTLASLQLQQDALRRHVQELGRAPHPPCPCQTSPTAPHTLFPSSHDSDIRFLPLDQQVAYVLRFAYALEEDLVHLRRLLFSHFPPPPPPSA
ncbi:SH3 domain-containing protein C23A1.17-like [Helianthus annuus]|uniref:SH3 domain-containing protein C23A1.17-like n=1 Tax=Helianthus annuus TaxID=4232 RepID=UPI000B8F79A8|nr:SH3 domain-containing protein C23A1.17-like [Helianthus annuus]